MKKISAIIAAVVLAFALAMGDQIYSAVSSDQPWTWQGFKSIFTGSEAISISTTKPKLPAVTTIGKKEEVPLSYEERMQKGDYYREKGFWTYAANEYAKASKLAPKSVAPYLRLTQANFELGDYDKARADVEQILELEPANTEAEFYLMLINIKESQFDKAESIISTLESSGITDPRLTFYKALIQIALGNHTAGKAFLLDVKKNPALGPELKVKVDKMLAGYNEYEFSQGAEDLYLGELLSRGLNEINEYELAIYKLKTILKTRTDLRDAWNLLGFAYLNLNNTLFAVSAFEQAYKLDPQLPATQYFLGITYYELGRKDDALVYLNYALSNGFEPKIVLERKLADLYLDKGDYQKSVETYEKILKENKQDINAFVRPIWIYLDFLNEPDKALKLGELAVVTFPENAMAYNLLGWSQIGTGNTVEAEKNLLKSIEMDSTQAAPYYNLGKLYEATKEINKAKDAYQKAYELDQNGSIGNLAAKRYNILLVQ